MSRDNAYIVKSRKWVCPKQKKVHKEAKHLEKERIRAPDCSNCSNNSSNICGKCVHISMNNSCICGKYLQHCNNNSIFNKASPKAMVGRKFINIDQTNKDNKAVLSTTTFFFRDAVLLMESTTLPASLAVKKLWIASPVVAIFLQQLAQIQHCSPNPIRPPQCPMSLLHHPGFPTIDQHQYKTSIQFPRICHRY